MNRTTFVTCFACFLLAEAYVLSFGQQGKTFKLAGTAGVRPVRTAEMAALAQAKNVTAATLFPLPNSVSAPHVLIFTRMDRRATDNVGGAAWVASPWAVDPRDITQVQQGQALFTDYVQVSVDRGSWTQEYHVRGTVAGVTAAWAYATGRLAVSVEMDEQ